MSKGVFRLSAADLRRSTPGLYGDGHGLWLQVTVAKDGTRRNRSWVFRYTTADGRVREMGLGPLVTVGLADARERARQCRLQRLDGIDPIEHRKARRAAQAAAIKRSMTFDECARALIATKRNEWRSEKHAKEWPQTLARDISPVIGRLPVDTIDTALVVKALTPVWQRAPESASRLRGRIEMILDWAAVSGLRRGDNPARWGGHLEHLLPAPRKIRRGGHLPAMPYTQLPSFMQKLRGIEGTTARALEFLILTAARRGEVLGMVWTEVDFTAAVWTVPATRMKAGHEHRVPLPPRCLEILRQQQAVYENALVFPGRDGPINGNGFKHAMRRLGADQYTPHGFRASFRTWASERTGFAHEIAEQALAHAVGSQITRAYRRTDMFDKRRALAAAWGDFCASPAAPAAAVVTPLRKPRADA